MFYIYSYMKNFLSGSCYRI